MTDLRHDWAAVAAAQIINTCLYRDAPKHEVYADVQRILEAMLLVALIEMRCALSCPSEN